MKKKILVWILTCVSSLGLLFGLSACVITTGGESSHAAHTLSKIEGKAATCTEKGVLEHYLCAECEKTFADDKGTEELTEIVLPALGHDEVIHAAKAATCTEIGWEEYVTCTRCDYDTYEEIPLSHDEVIHAAKAATCTEIGWEEYVTCTRCDYDTYEEIPAGHDEVPHSAQSATCEEIGWDAYVTCNRCNYNTYEEIPALGHDEVPHSAQEEDCTNVGWSAYVTCNRCEYSTYEEIPALDHDEAPHSAQAATCEEIGWDAYVTCNRCNYTTYEEIPALGHDEVPHSAQAATCEEIGWDAYVTCNRCNYNTYEEISALGHDEVPHSAKAATCEEIGWEAYVFCTRCGYTTYEEIPATGHTESVDEEVAATCTSTGLTAGSHCSVCKQVLVAQQEISKAEHTYDGEYICTVCSYRHAHTYADKLTGDDSGHWYAPTCGHSDGAEKQKHTFNSEYVCEDCGYVDRSHTAVELSADGLIAIGLKDKTVTHLVIPDGVTEIADYAFESCKFESVVIPDSVVTIGKGAFYSYVNLQEVTLGKGVKLIKEDAFWITTSMVYSVQKVYYTGTLAEWCNIEFVTNTSHPLVASNLYGTYRGGDLYIDNVLLTDLVLPQEITEVTPYMFYNCKSLKSVTFSKNVERISAGAFGTNYFTDINIEEGNPYYDVVGECLIERATKTLVLGCGNSVIPADGSVVRIGAGAFSDCQALTEITIPQTVTTIEGGAFGSSHFLKEITIPNSVVSIGEGAFSGCYSLQSIVMPDGVEEIGERTFENCVSLQSVAISGNIEVIGARAFLDCVNLQTLTIENGVKEIGDYAFRGCESLTEVSLPNSVERLGDYAFGVCANLTEIVVPENVTYVGTAAFSYCPNLKTVYWNAIECKTFSPYTTSSLNAGFSQCLSLEEFIFGEKVSYIPARLLLASGKKITNIRIPDSVTQVGDQAFDWCTNLEYQEFENGLYLGNENNPYILLVKAKDTGITACTVHDDAKIIGAWAFDGCTLLEEMIIPEGVISIHNYAFRNCTSLKNLSIPESVRTMGQYSVFENVNGLQTLTVPAQILSSASLETSNVRTLTITGEGEFDLSSSSKALISINIGEGITSIRGAFSECDNLTEVYIADVAAWCAIEFLGENGNPLRCAERVYVNNQLTTNLVVPEGVTEIKNYAFYGAPFEGYSLPNTIETIGESAFRDCTALKEIVIPDSVALIKISAFRGCSSLAKITMGKGVKTVQKWAFEDCSALNEVHVVDLAAWCGVDFIWSSAPYYIESNPLYYAHNLYLNGELALNLVIPEGVTAIKHGAFYGCEWIVSVTLPSTLERIEDYAFSGCKRLKEVYNFSQLPIVADTSGAFGFVGYYAESVYTEKGETSNVYATEDGYVFHTDSRGEACLIGYTGKDTQLVLPDTCNGAPYIILGCAFENNTSITSVRIGDGATNIQPAFSGCTALKEVFIGKGVTYVSNFAFEDCNALTNILVSDENETYQSIDGTLYTKDGKTLLAYAKGKGEKEYTVPDGVTTIESGAFAECTSLERVVLPESVTYIGGDAFSGCSALVSVNIPAGVTMIQYRLFEGCSSLTSLVLPDGVTYIDSYAFYGCESLAEINIPDGVTTIGSYAFQECNALTSLILPSSVTCIEEGALSGSSLEYVLVAEGNAIYTSQDGILYNHDKTEIVYVPRGIKGAISIADGITTIEISTFSSCKNLTSVIIPNSVTSIGNRAFRGCIGLKSVTLPESIVSIGEYAFSDCSSLTSIVIPDGVTSIGNGVFSRCIGLKSVTLPESIVSIGEWAFSDCSSLTSIVIPDGVTSIGNRAFRGCIGLKSVTLPESIVSIGEYAFDECYTLLEVVNKSALVIEAGEWDWSTGYVGRYAKQVITNEADSKIIKENGYIFYNDDGTYYLIGYEGKDTDLLLPEKVDGNDYGIYQYAFYKRSSLTSIVMPDNVTSIGKYAFCGCSGLTSVTLSNSITVIAQSAFSDCSSLTDIVIPESVTSIGEWAFSDCSSLTDIVIPESVTWIQNSAFSRCSALTSVTLPDSVDWIKEGLFQYCSNLTSVVLSNRVSIIQNAAFYECSSLTEVYYEGTESQWSYITIDKNNICLINATRYYYSETQPADEGNYWRYVDGVPTAW